jgi:nicotinate-nucleotide adenylyltransferase
MTLVLCGGSFDPVHIGHLAIADAVHRACQPEQLIWLPAKVSPHKLDRPPIAAEHRLAMLQCAIHGRRNESICRYELDQAGPSYAVQTLRFLREQYPGQAMQFLIGADTLARLAEWHQVEQLLQWTDFLILPRADCPVLDLEAYARLLPNTLQAHFRGRCLPMEPVAASSSQIRSHLQRGQDCRELLPTGVADYIERHALYGSSH